MEEDTLTAQIPSNFYAILAVAIVALFLVGGLSNLEIEVNEAQKTQYRQAAVLENVMELDANTTELENSGIDAYNYSERRGLIPIEYFNNRVSSDSEDVGFYSESVNFDTDANCFIPEVPGLEPGKYAYRIDIMKEQAEASGSLNSYQIPGQCEEQYPKTQGELGESVFSQALLVRENLDKPPLPVRIYVYSLG